MSGPTCSICHHLSHDGVRCTYVQPADKGLISPRCDCRGPQPECPGPSDSAERPDGWYWVKRTKTSGWQPDCFNAEDQCWTCQRGEPFVCGPRIPSPDERNERLDGVTVDPNIQDGLPCVTGTRIPVSAILRELHNHGSIEKVALTSWPGTINEEQIKDVLWYANEQLATDDPPCPCTRDACLDDVAKEMNGAEHDATK